MTETKHTPGPWSLDEDDMSVMAEGGSHICNVTDAQDFPCLDEDEHDIPAIAAECFANGKLIAAAPELLETLRRVHTTLEAIGDLPSMRADIADALAKAGVS